MKPAPFLSLSARVLGLFALALGTGLLPSAAQDAKPMPARPPAVRPLRPDETPPPPDSAEPEAAPASAGVPELGANYRILIRATANGRQTGELATQTCSAAFQIHGCMGLPTAEDPIGTDLSVRGNLSEVEGGRLRLGYSLAVSDRVPSQTFGTPGSGQEVVANHRYMKNGASGMLLLQPGRSYELMQISGVVYSLSLTPTETWPAAKHAAPTPGDTPNKAAAEPGENKPSATERRATIEEDRKRYENFSARAKEKFRDAMREHFSQEQFRNAPEEERRARIKELFDKIEAEDKANAK